MIRRVLYRWSDGSRAFREIREPYDRDPVRLEFIFEKLPGRFVFSTKDHHSIEDGDFDEALWYCSKERWNTNSFKLTLALDEGHADRFVLCQYLARFLADYIQIPIATSTRWTWDLLEWPSYIDDGVFERARSEKTQHSDRRIALWGEQYFETRLIHRSAASGLIAKRIRLGRQTIREVFGPDPNLRIEESDQHPQRIYLPFSSEPLIIKPSILNDPDAVWFEDWSQTTARTLQEILEERLKFLRPESKREEDEAMYGGEPAFEVETFLLLGSLAPVFWPSAEFLSYVTAERGGI